MKRAELYRPLFITDRKREKHFHQTSLVPHFRQKLSPGVVCAPQFGQYKIAFGGGDPAGGWGEGGG
jgi:hypothetical protein